MKYIVTITEIEEKEVVKTQLRNVAKEGEKERYEYVHYNDKDSVKTEVYRQEFGDIDLQDIVTFLNKV